MKQKKVGKHQECAVFQENNREIQELGGKMPGRKRKVSSISDSDESSSTSTQTSSDELTLLPEKSKAHYQKVWDEFILFLQEKTGYPKRAPKGKQYREPTEKDYRSFYAHLKEGKEYAPSTLWTYHSILSTQHKDRYNVNLKDKFPRLAASLKNLRKCHKPKKAPPFTREDIVEFLSSTSAPGQDKALCSLAYFGGLRCGELRTVLLENITSDANGLRIKFVGLKRVAEEEDREFLIPVTANGNLFVQVVLDHIAALKKSNIESGPIARRPAPRGSGFTIAPIGRNSFYALPKRIATVLQKKSPDQFTGHSLRRTSARAAADGGADQQALMRHFGWRSQNLPRHYIDSSLHSMQSMAANLSGAQTVQSPAQTIQPQALQRIVIDMSM